MALIDDLSERLKPHTERLTATIQHGLGRIENRVSDLNKIDTGDTYRYIVRRGKLKGPEPLTQQVGGRGESGPGPGEIWLMQFLCTNGAILKSPGFAIRTNTGRLVAAFAKEVSDLKNPGGDVPVQFGEELVFETEAEGEFDFTVCFRRMLIPHAVPNAIGGISQERADRPSHANELAERQLQQIPWSPDSPWHSHASPDGMPGGGDYGGDIDPSGIIAGEPGDTEPET